MKHLVTAAMAMAALSGCATVMNDATQPIRVDTKTADGHLIAGADCALSNDKGRFTLKSGQTVQVRRSSRDLEVSCVLPGQRNAAGRSISRANIGIWGNILIGGAIGAIVDHSKGTGYTYPSWIQLVFGQTLSFDRHREDRGQPLQGDNAHVATTASGTESAPGEAVTLPLAGEVAPPVQAGTAAPASEVAATVAPAGPAMSTESASTRAQGISSGLNCGTVQAHSATRFTAACSGGSTVQIDCAGFRCSATFP
ncbi:putative hemolysin [Xanthomonas arboricola]|nr:putative hemolysin [Xanthomonas euroxanthea]